MHPVKLIIGSNALKFILLVALSVALVSCETVNYYSQAARGQLAIVLARKDIQQLLVSSDGLSTELKSKFATVLEIRDFAENELVFDIGTRLGMTSFLTLLLAAGRSFRGAESEEPQFFAYVGLQFLFE